MTDIQWPLAKYRLLKRAYMPRTPGGAPEMLEEGETIEYDGKPGVYEGDWMEPLDDAGKQAVEMAKQIIARRDAYRQKTGHVAQQAMAAAFDERAMPSDAELLADATDDPPKPRRGRPPAQTGVDA